MIVEGKGMWNKEKILHRVELIRTRVAEEQKRLDLELRIAMTLEEIAKEWPEPRTAHWIRWGQYLKCSACGHMVEEKADECPECGARMEK